MIDIALVIVTFNRSKFLMEMLNSAIKQTVLPSVIYVVDNNSTDNTEELVQDFIGKSNKIVTVIYCNTGANLGGAGGFEYGSRLAYDAGHEWIWLADDDVELDLNCLARLLEYNEASDIIQPMRINMDESCAEVSGIDYEINSITRLNPKRKTVVNLKDENWETIELKTIPFEGPMIHRRVFERIGFPDPRFFIFYDDLDFALRAQNSGFKILCIRKAILKRKIPFVQSRALGTWKGYFMYRNFFYVQITYAKKYVSYVRVTLIFLLVAIHALATGKAKSLPMLLDAFKHGLNSDFSANDKYKPS